MDKNHNWILFKNGDQSAFEKMYREYVNELFDYGKKFSIDTSLVEDCIQDMFIDLWVKRGKLSDVKNVKAYLFVSLKRRIIKTLKKDKIDTIVNEETYFQSELSIEMILEKGEIKLENAQKLQNAFKNLNKKQQHILYLKFYQGFNNKEITDILQINYQSTRNALNRALSKLKSNFSLWLLLLGFNILLKIT